MSDQEQTEVDRSRRNDISKQALDVGMEDPYWLDNLSIDIWYHDGHDDTLTMAEELREDAEVLETAHQKLKEGVFTGGEAAVYVARRANFGEYDIGHWLDQGMPITEEP